MNFLAAYNWLLGLRTSGSVDSVQVALAAPWARDGGFWVFLAVVAALIGAAQFYRRFQHRGATVAKSMLAIVRGTLLALLVLTLANPFLRITANQRIQPTVRLLIDGSESMLTRDLLQEGASRRQARIEAVQSALRHASSQLSELDCRIEVFVFDGTSTSRSRELAVDASQDRSAFSHVADKLSPSGKVSALGAALSDMARFHPPANLAAVVFMSDFAHNAGPSPVAAGTLADISLLRCPVHTVGVGMSELPDVLLEFEVDPKLKKGEQTTLRIALQSSGVGSRDVQVQVTGRPLHSNSSIATGAPGAATIPPDADALPPIEATAAAAGEADFLIARRRVTLGTAPVEISVPFVPDQVGLWELTASVPALPVEIVRTNNSATRRVVAIDDFLRLLYVAFEPSWEWRFVKEAFHRDRLVGIEGFRTFLESSDPRVRRDNVLFLETLPTRRDLFFAHDVIILDDVPSRALTVEFCGLVEEFVGKMGGGLIVMAGPRFGLRGIAEPALRDLLPVYIDRNRGLRDDREFVPVHTANAERFAFMNLGDAEMANDAAWASAGRVPWYQPVANLHEQSSVLAEHPLELCDDGTTKQPVIAIRKYGRGEVVFVAHNELWRLRRGQGERFHRRFWSQLIYRLGMSHALGDEKRFVIHTDRQEYQLDDFATVSVEAYDADYRPLDSANTVNELAAIHAAEAAAGGNAARVFKIPWLRDGIFETRIPLDVPGLQTVRVQDPVTGRERSVQFAVTDTAAEQRDPVRNLRLQQELAARTGGQSYDVAEFSQLVANLKLLPEFEQREWTRAFWTTPLWFILVVGLMLSEWLGRRLVHLK